MILLQFEHEVSVLPHIFLFVVVAGRCDFSSINRTAGISRINDRKKGTCFPGLRKYTSRVFNQHMQVVELNVTQL